MDFQTSSSGTINGALTNAWKVVLTSTNGTLNFVNFDPGALLTLVVQEDASGSNYTLTFPSTVKWQAGAPPNRDTTANAVSVYTFSYDGTNWRDIGTSAKGLPSRIVSVALGTLIGVGVTAMVLTSGNGGQGTARVGAPGFKDQVQYVTGTGANAETVAKINASGSFVGGASGALAIGSMTLDGRGADAKFFVTPAGSITVRNNASGYTLLGGGGVTTINRNVVSKADVSGATLHMNGPGSGSVLCVKTNGQVGSCGGVVGTTGKCGPCS